MKERLLAIFGDWIKLYTIDNMETLSILFTINEAFTTEIVWKTLKELKPIYDKFGGKLKFDEKDEKVSNGTLPIYMAFDNFYQLYEKLLADLSGNTDDGLLYQMIVFDESRNLGHSVFLRYVYEKRNPKGA